MRFFYVILIGCCVPGAAWASVAVSEVAWMGSEDNANAEWIELCTDSTTDLTGWSLAALDGQPTIPLAGTLAGCGLLERTGDETVQSVPALVVYTGALGNSGEVLELRDAEGRVVDRVDGSNWAIGGDNTTKLTLQRAGSFGAWITAPPTPGTINGTTDNRSTSGTTADNPTTSRSITKNTSNDDHEVNLPPSPSPDLRIAIGGDRSVVAGVPVVFRARAYNESGKEITLETIAWNFGDGAIGTGSEEIHTYQFPGDYAVLARGERSLFRTPVRAEDRVVLRVVPCLVRVSGANVRAIELSNDGVSDVELTRFTLVAGSQRFRIPDGTVLLTGKSVQFPAAVTKLSVTDPTAVALFSPHNALVSQFTATSARPNITDGTNRDIAAEDTERSREVAPDEEPVPHISPARVPVLASMEDMFVPIVQVAAPMREELQEKTATFTQLARVGAREQVSGIAWWLAALFSLIGLAVATVLLVRRERGGVAEEYTIEES